MLQQTTNTRFTIKSGRMTTVHHVDRNTDRHTERVVEKHVDNVANEVKDPLANSLIPEMIEEMKKDSKDDLLHKTGLFYNRGKMLGKVGKIYTIIWLNILNFCLVFREDLQKCLQGIHILHRLHMP